MGVSSPFVLTHTTTPSSARTREVSAGNKNMLTSTTTAAEPLRNGSTEASDWIRRPPVDASTSISRERSIETTSRKAR